MNESSSQIGSGIDHAFSKTTLAIAGGFLMVYFLLIYFFVGLRTDHLYFSLFLLITYFAHPSTRKFVLGFIFFWMFWIIYDGMRVYPNYLVNPIHVIEPYTIEKQLFGISVDGVIQTPNEFLKSYYHSTLDLLSGLFYLTWVPVPMAFAIYLFFKDKEMMLRFSACFLFTNLAGFVIYYLYPAAPPWYVDLHGFDVDFNIPGNSARLSAFDDLVGAPIFANMYNKNANVFAAIPSLHSAYPIVLFYYGLKKKYKIASILFFLDILGIWFAAVYSMHHYIIDVLLGAFCAIIAIFVFEKWLMRTRLKEYLNKYVNFIT